MNKIKVDRNTPRLIYPVGNFKNVSSNFRDQNFYDGKEWGIHLGVDIDVPADTKVFAIGRGTVVYSKLHPGEFTDDGRITKRNWGGLVIISHKNPRTNQHFFSLYGHLGKRFVKKGDQVEMGEFIGTVGKSMTESNGIWYNEHIHFSIYSGPFHFKVLPGYYDINNENTNLSYWRDPLKFIRNYSRLSREEKEKLKGKKYTLSRTM